MKEIVSINAISGTHYSNLDVIALQALNTNTQPVTVIFSGKSVTYPPGSLLMGHEYSMNIDEIYFNPKDSFVVKYRKSRFLNEVIR